MRLLTLNVAHGRGPGRHQALQTPDAIRGHLDRVVDLLRRERPNIVALQEADGPSTWSGQFDHVGHLGEAAGLAHFFRGGHGVDPLKKLGIDYGTALLSDTPLGEPRSVAFADSWRDTKGYVVASAADIDVVSVHLDFLRPAVRRRQIRTLVEGVRTRSRPLVVLGDLNCRGRGRDATLPALIDRLGLHSWADGESTFPSRNPRLRIDWILLSPELEFVDHRTLPDPVSDHLAVVADVRLRST